MKHSIVSLIIPALFGLSFTSVRAQSSFQNYIMTTAPTTTVSDLTSLNDNNSLTTIQYSDGLGRPIESVQRAITPNNSSDLVSGVTYDILGRDSLHWLPGTVAGNNGAYVAGFTSASMSTYSDSRSCSATLYESSPLSRVTTQYVPGSSWYYNNKKKTIAYQSNSGSDVIYLSVSNNQLIRTNNYSADSLYVTQLTDEDGKTTTEYKDKQGQVVMKRDVESGNVDTYYVYDDYGRLRYVLPPNFVNSIGSTTSFADDNTLLKQYAYLYRYDERGNNVMKRLPGCDSICMVYDMANRLVLSQDGNQRLKNKWTATKYDVFGRVIYTGILNSTLSRVQQKSLYDSKVVTESYTTGTGYSCTNFCDATPLSINYYDSYDFISLLTVAADKTNLAFAAKSGYDSQYSSAKGLLTGTRTYILDNIGTNYLTIALYYDKYGRVVQTRATNQLGGYNVVYNQINFIGKASTTYKEHNIANQTVIPEAYYYSYDKAGRSTYTTYVPNNKSGNTSRQNYDELSRLSSTIHLSFSDTISYAYNIQNWTTKIKSGTFEEDVYYNTNPFTANSLYNGNISYNSWTYNGVTKGYAYTYDGLNRLTNAAFKQVTSTQPNGYFDEIFTFDNQGNITTLKRKKDNILIDDLLITPNGNQIKSVIDNAGSQHLSSVKEYQNISTATNVQEFFYDPNGNLTADLDRDIVTIRYNILNLPDIIQFKYGNQIKNIYDASGRKLQSDYYTKLTPLSVPLTVGQVLDPMYLTADYCLLTGTDYVGNIEYSFSNDGGDYQFDLDKIYNPEGYSQGLTTPVYYYYRKDHLGNNREVWNANTNTPVQRTQYYPSGLPWAEGLNPGLQQRKYNGKEFIEMSGYDTYDYGARGMYPALGIFTTVDPLAEKYYSISPYAYCGGNPVRFIDNEGKYIDIWYPGKNGAPIRFRFNGDNGGQAPNNAYVQDFIKAYNYDVKNGGGDNLKEAATNNRLAIGIAPSWTGSDEKDYYDYTENIIHWDSHSALFFMGIRLSPATILEHEMDHAVAANKDLLSYLVRMMTNDILSDNKEEGRTMSGSEKKTGYLNKELKKNQQRTFHEGDLYNVSDPTSTKPSSSRNNIYSMVYSLVIQNPNIIVTFK